VRAHFGDDAPLIGAIEEAFAAVLTDDGLRAWSSCRQKKQENEAPLDLR